VEKSIIHWSTHYKKYITLSLVLSILVVCNFLMWQPLVRSYLLQYSPKWRDLLEWQGIFLSGQLTIIGVVYPLVVGLISILFQNKSARNVIFPIYQKYSGFMFAGLSGLGLSGFIVVGYFLRASLGDAMYAGICLTSAMWLLVNLLLTAWFFVQTFRMLDEKSREGIVLRYSIHEACETDVRERIKQVLLQNAVHQKLLINPDEQVLEVLTQKYSNDDYQDITRVVKREKSLKDVKFWLINTAIRLQISILKFRKAQGCKLVIQPLRSNRTSNVMNIAKYGGFEINPIVQFLIKTAFSFTKDLPHTDIGLSTVLNSFVGPANDAFRNGDARELSDAVDNLVLWHTEVAQALSFNNDDGKLDNWLLLPASGLWGRTYLDELLGEYFRLAREAVERIPENSRFYADMLSLHKRIFSSRDTLIDKEMRLLIQGSYYMWYLLVEWRSYNSESNDNRIANKYEDILYDFVGSWESWLMYIEPRSIRTGDINNVYPAFITHLEFTASTAISALRFNNFEAAGWGVDMLNNWLDMLTHDDHWYEEYHWRSVLINHGLLKLSSNGSAWEKILKNNQYNYRAAFDLAFKNAHLDLRVITACYVLLKPGNEQQHLVTYVNSLLSGKRIHQEGSITRSSSNIGNAGELVGAYIRHRDYGHYGEGTYGRWLSSILESFGRINEERRVSGRIYSGWGAEDPRSMNKAYVEIAVSLSERTWSLPSDWVSAIMSDAFRHKDRKAIISDLNDWMKIANEEHAYILVQPENREAFKANFIESVEELIEKVGKAQNEAIVRAVIDPDQLERFGIASSTILLSKNKTTFPLTLFEYIDRDAELDEACLRVINILDYEKERVAVGIDTDRAVNEYDWLANCISGHIKKNILRVLFGHPLPASSEYGDINSILFDIQSMSETLACPVLFVGNESLKKALFRSLREKGVAQKHNISRQDGFDNEYICHINRCEVYSISFSDVDYCILTSKELFDAVGFKKLADDRYVEADFELNQDSETLGKLKLKYWMKVSLKKDTSCIKLILSTKEECLI